MKIRLSGCKRDSSYLRKPLGTENFTDVAKINGRGWVKSCMTLKIEVR